MKKLPTAVAFVAALAIGGMAVYYYRIHKKKDTSDSVAFNIPNRGSIQILNGCGAPGAGQVIADILRRNSFDVKEIANAPDWNYKETIVARRSSDTSLAIDLAKTLGTGNLIPLVNNSGIYDVTVFVGADYRELAKKRLPE